MINHTHLSVTLHPEEGRSDSSGRLIVNVRMITGTGKNFKSVPKDFDLNSIASKPFQLESNLPYKIEATFFDVMNKTYKTEGHCEWQFLAQHTDDPYKGMNDYISNSKPVLLDY